MPRAARDLSINLLASLLFAIGIFAFSKAGAAWALVAGLAVALAGCTYLVFRGPGRRAKTLLGLTDVRPGPNKSIEQMLDGAKHSIDFLGLSGNRTGRSATSKTAMDVVSENSGRIRFLLLHPDSTHLLRRAEDEGDDPASLRADILGTVRRLQTIKHSGANIRVHYYDRYPIFRMVTLDNETMSINWFLDGRQGHHSPELKLTVNKEGLSAAIANYFEELWLESEDAFESLSHESRSETKPPSASTPSSGDVTPTSDV